MINRYVIALTRIHNRPIFGKVSLVAAERHSPIIAIATEMLSFAIVQKENRHSHARRNNDT